MERMMAPECTPTPRPCAALGRLKIRTLRRASVSLTGLITICLLYGCDTPNDSPARLELCKDPSRTCVLSNGMSLQTHSVPTALTPIEVTVRDVSTSVTSVRLEASMTGMSMPQVGVDLHGTGPSEWSGQLILPVCSQGRTDWQWTLVTRVGDGEQRTNIQVEVHRH